MLLLVMQTDFEDADHLRQISVFGTGEQALDRLVDMAPECGHIVAIGARDQPALRPRVTRAGSDVIRVEEIGEALIEDAIPRKVRNEQELLQEPAGMRAVPFGRARIGHRLHHLVLGGERRGAAFGFRAHGAKGVPPYEPRIGGRGTCEGCVIISVAAATKDG